MDDDLNQFFENIENETTIDNMFFGDDDNKIPLENIYKEAKNISSNNEKIYYWHNNYFIKLSKSVDRILLNIEILNKQGDVLAFGELDNLGR